MAVRFVGRHRELEAVRALVAEVARDREPLALVLTGDPGSGKTRLLSEARVGAAIERQALLLGYEPERQSPLAAASELLRALCAGPSGEALETLLFSPSDRTLDALRIFEAAHRALFGFGGEILLVLDDVQWFDETSLALCRYLLRAGSDEPRALVAAARPSDRAATLAEGLRSALGSERVRTMELGPLSASESADLVREIVPLVEDGISAAIVDRANGSPFWIETLARAGGETGRALEERLQSLESDAAELVAVLSCAAQPLTDAEVGWILEWELPRVRFAVTDAVRRGVVVEGMGGARLTHDLIREGATRALGESRRRTVHRRIGEMLVEQAGEDVSLLRRALGHLRDGGGETTELARRLVASPGRRLLGPAGLADLMEMTRGAPPDPVLDAGLARLASDLGEHQVALEAWLDVGQHGGDASTRARALLEASKAAFAAGRLDDASEMLARSRATSRDEWLGIAQDAHEAQILLWLNRKRSDAEPPAGRALDAARREVSARGGLDSLSEGERDAYLRAIHSAFDVASVGGRWADAGALSEEMLEAAHGSDIEYLEASYSAAQHLKRTGRFLQAESAIRRVWTSAREQLFPAIAMKAGYSLARSLYGLGRLDEADAVAAASDELGHRIGRFLGDTARMWAGWYGTDLVRGDWQGGIASLERRADEQADPHLRIGPRVEMARALARIAGSAQADEITGILERAHVDAEAAGCESCRGELDLCSAEAFARLGHGREAEALIGTWEERHPDPGLWENFACALVHALAPSPDSGRLEKVCARADEMGLALEALWARIDYGRSLPARTNAVKVLSEAAAQADEIGALTVRRIAEQTLRTLGVRAWRRGRTARGESLGRLSDRERQIAGMVAGGASNPEIAAALFLSRRTVEHHVSAILLKLGLKNRAELASAVSRAE